MLDRTCWSIYVGAYMFGIMLEHNVGAYSVIFLGEWLFYRFHDMRLDRYVGAYMLEHTCLL